MRLLLIPILAISLATAQEDRVTTVDTSRKAGVLCQLQRVDGDQPGYLVRFENRSGRGTRIDYRALSRTTSTWTGTVILRPGGDSGMMTVALPTGSDYFGADILTVTTGTIHEKTETRTAADGTLHSITVLELIDEAALAKERERAAAATAETHQLKREVVALRREQEASAMALQRAEQDAREAAEAARRAQADAEAERYRLLMVSYLDYHRDYRSRHEQPVRPSQPVASTNDRELTAEEFINQQIANERKVWKN